MSNGVTLTPIGFERLENVCKEGLSASTSLKVSIEDAASELQVDADTWFKQVPKYTAKKLNELMLIASSAPELPSKTLFQFELIENLPALKELAAKLLTYQTSCSELNSKLIEGWKSNTLEQKLAVIKRVEI